MIKTQKQALEIIGSLSNPSKMPSYSYGLPPQECKVGSKLRNKKGSSCESCYAFEGFYKVYHKTISKAQYVRFRAIRHEHWVDAMVFLLTKRIPKTLPKKQRVFRWHDAGDIQDVEHLDKIVNVVSHTPWIKHWIPTREHRLIQEYLYGHGKVFPSNLVVRMSATMVDGQPPLRATHTSTIHKDKSPVGYPCPAHQQDNECKDCRACWDKRVKNVSYHYH